jgi:hypothetical protein
LLITWYRPSEIHTLHIKPVDFFDGNPALDVPGTKNSTSVRSASSCCADASPEVAVPVLPESAAGHWQADTDIDLTWLIEA